MIVVKIGMGLLGLGLMCPVLAQAAGVMQFHGAVVQPTCVIHGGDNAAYTVVTLPSVSSQHLSTHGQRAGETAFTIRLSLCDPSARRLRAYFQSGRFTDAESGRLNIDHTYANTAKHLQIEISHPDQGEVIALGQPSQSNPYVPIDNDGSVELRYEARYYAQGRVVSGYVRSQVTYVLQYL
jgi:major type 1 subunit fimbrin (pilin)